MRYKEKLFKNYKFRRNKQTVSNNFKNARHLFNKQFRIYGHQYERAIMMEIESLNTKNLQNFGIKLSLWGQHIKNQFLWQP